MLANVATVFLGVYRVIQGVWQLPDLLQGAINVFAFGENYAKWVVQESSSVHKFCFSLLYTTCFGILLEGRVQQQKFQGIICEVNNLCWKLDNCSWSVSALIRANPAGKAVRSVPSHHLDAAHLTVWKKRPSNDSQGNASICVQQSWSFELLRKTHRSQKCLDQLHSRNNENTIYNLSTI